MNKKHGLFFGFTVLFLLCGIGILFLSCATKSDAYKDIDVAVDLNDFEGAIEAIKAGQEGKKPLYDEKNAISLYLDKGLLELYAGNYGNSVKDLIEAERLIEEAYTKSITAGMASYIANDNTKEYPGEDYEDIYINVFNALNFYNNGNTEGALVEVRKLTQSSGKLDMLSRKYEEANKSAGQYVLDALGNIGIVINPELPQGEPVNFSNSALARYLSVLFYLDEDNEDSARIEFEQLNAAFESNPNVYYNPIPKSVENMQTVTEGMARLNIIGFAGLSPIKVENIITVPVLLPVREMNLKLPKLMPRSSVISGIEAEVQGQGSFKLELLEDMTKVIEETYKARFGNVFLKTYIRILLKNAVSSAGASRAGAFAGLALLGGKVAADASEAADIRMGRFFPSKAYIGAVDLEPGTYTITVNFGSGVKEFKDVNVKAGKVNLIQAVNLH